MHVRHLKSLIAPIVMCCLIPLVIVLIEHQYVHRPVITTTPSLLFLGLVLGAVGSLVAVATIRMFMLIGNGTIMPWDPTRKLIVVSLYRYVRNPMMAGLTLILVGEALVFGSSGIAVLAMVNVVFNTVYFIVSEEPSLAQRFGDEYVDTSAMCHAGYQD